MALFASNKRKPSVLLHFYFLLLPFLFLSGCIDPDILVDDVSYYWDKSRCNLRVGILSDTHLDPPHSDKMFQKALSYFAEREVDAVVLAGDVTDEGTLAQRRGTKKIWDKVFPNGKRKDGKPVALIVVTGESDDEKVYEELAGRPYATVFSQEVRGFTFVGANWKDAAHVDAWSLKPLLAKVDKTKPFFYVQNLVPYGTCCPNEGRLDVFEGGKISYMLSKFPNAVAICGRSHTSLTDESAFWCGDFVCVNAGSFSYAKRRGPDGAANLNAHHGLVMSVYDSGIVFERVDFGQETKDRFQKGVYVEKLGKDWTVELPAKASKRAETDAPQFWDDTRLMIFPSAKSVSVRFPPVLAKHTGVRAHSYEVVAKGPDGAVVSTQTVVSPGFCWSEAHETKPIACDFPRAELPNGKVVFEVTPLDAFGKCGRPVVGEVTL